MSETTAPNPLVPTGSELSDGTTQTTVKAKWVPSLKGAKLKIKLPALKDITWAMLWHATVEFLADPINVAVVVWVVLSVPACILIMAVKLGLLEHYASHEELEHIDEVATQLVNALFTLTCLIIFPLLCRHTFLLIRWKPNDKVELRQAYCKNGKRKPHDWTHIMIVVFWGQVTCWATFAFSAIYWILPAGSRPAWMILVTFTLSMVAPVISLIYLLVSPLSKDYDIVKEGDDDMLRMYQRTHAFFVANKQVQDAKWSGTVFPGCCADKKVACLVCVFPCCMFGFNMERLGFGHRVVHTLAFIVVLLGPALVFELSAEALPPGTTQTAMFFCGIFLAVLGVAYGGAWRIKMRETYNLPASRIFCWSKRLTDVCIWVWCSYCALCQEIRTTEQYQVEENAYQYSQAPDGEAGGPEIVAPEGDEDFMEVGPKTSPPPQLKMESETKAENIV